VLTELELVAGTDSKDSVLPFPRLVKFYARPGKQPPVIVGKITNRHNQNAEPIVIVAKCLLLERGAPAPVFCYLPYVYEPKHIPALTMSVSLLFVRRTGDQCNVIVR